MRVPRLTAAKPQSSIGFGGRAPRRAQARLRPLQRVAPAVQRTGPKLLVGWPSTARRLGCERRFLHGEARLGQGIGRLATSERTLGFAGITARPFTVLRSNESACGDLISQIGSQTAGHPPQFFRSFRWLSAPLPPGCPRRRLASRTDILPDDVCIRKCNVRHRGNGMVTRLPTPFEHAVDHRLHEHTQFS